MLYIVYFTKKIFSYQKGFLRVFNGPFKGTPKNPYFYSVCYRGYSKELVKKSNYFYKMSQ